MKRKILAMTLIAAMAAIPATACAEVGGTITKSAPDDVQIQTMPQGTPAYARHDAAVKEIADGSIMLDIGEELPETATVDENTIFFTSSGDVTDISAVKAGEKISVFVDADTPIPEIYPAKYPASYVVVGDGENYAGVDIDVYTESDSLGMYLNGAKDLAINVDENSTIVPADGTKIHIDYTDLAGRELAVFYSKVTMSIPGQTYPDKIVILPADENNIETVDCPIKPVSAYVRKDAEILSASKSEENGIEVKTLEVKDDSESEPYRINVTNAAILDNSGDPVDIFDENFHNVKISAFIDASSPAPAINPPLYYADVVIVNKDGAEGNYDVDVYTKGEEEGSYVNAANSLVINTSESTSIVPSNATKIRIDYTDLDGRKLVVFYTNSTRSIPAQTNPDKIVALVSGDIMEPQKGDGYLNDVFYEVVKTATESEYDPDVKLTRGMMVNALANLASAPKDGKTDIYTDIDANAYYAPYVAWATENGLIKGFGDGTFRPDDAITREQAVVIITNYFSYKGEGPVGSWAVRMGYSDLDKVSDWAMDGVMFCTMKEIIHGREDGSFDPQANITCGEFAVMLGNIKNGTM